MKKDNILGIIIMTFGLLLIVSVFLPYANQFSVTSSLWNILSSSRLIYIFLGIFVIVLYLFNKKITWSSVNLASSECIFRASKAIYTSSLYVIVV
mgnify:CR=1 FL=1